MAYKDWTKLYKEAVEDGMKQAGKIADHIIANTDDPNKPARGRPPASYKESVVAWVRKKGPIKEGLARLIEADVSNANLIVAAQAIPDILQDMVEKLAGIEKSNILPLQSQLSEEFGPEVASQFAQAVLGKVREIQDEIMSAKDFLDTQVKNVETVVNGGQMPTDMDMAGQAPAPDAGMPDFGGQASGQAPAPDASAQPPAPEGDASGMPSDADIANADGSPPLGADDQNPAGRARKESRTIRGKNISEAKKKNMHAVYAEYEKEKNPKKKAALKKQLDDGHYWELPHQTDARLKKEGKPTHESFNVRYETSDKKKFTTGSGTAVHVKENRISEGKLNRSEAMKKDTSFYAEEDDGTWGVFGDNTGFCYEYGPKANDQDSPPTHEEAAKRIAKEMTSKKKTKAKESLTIRGRQIEESINKLRESKNPDAIVLAEFRNNLKNYSTAGMAALRTAKTFRIDLSDVVDVVKEAKKHMAAAKKDDKKKEEPKKKTVKKPVAETQKKKASSLKKGDVIIQGEQKNKVHDVTHGARDGTTKVRHGDNGTGTSLYDNDEMILVEKKAVN